MTMTGNENRDTVVLREPHGGGGERAVCLFVCELREQMLAQGYHLSRTDEVAALRAAAARDFALAAEWKETAERYRVEAAIARDRAENPNK